MHSDDDLLQSWKQIFVVKVEFTNASKKFVITSHWVNKMK